MNRIKEKFVYIAKKSVYDRLREMPASDNSNFTVLSPDSIVFVGDEGAIYTHNHKFGGSSQNNNGSTPSQSQSQTGEKTILCQFEGSPLVEITTTFTTNEIPVTLENLNADRPLIIYIPDGWLLNNAVLGLLPFSMRPGVQTTKDGANYIRYESYATYVADTYEITIKIKK